MPILLPDGRTVIMDERGNLIGAGRPRKSSKNKKYGGSSRRHATHDNFVQKESLRSNNGSMNGIP